MVWRDRGLSSWYKDGMSLPKDILPKSSSSTSGSFVLAEGVIEHLLALEAATSRERC